MVGTLYKDKTSGYDGAMGKRDPFNFRFDSPLMERMNAHAAREGRSRNSLIERIMRAYDADPRIQDLVRQFVEPTA